MSFDLSQHLCALRRSLFLFAKLLSSAAEPGGGLPLTDCAVAERGVFVKDGELSVEISGGYEWCDGLGKILFKGVFVSFTDRAELCSYRLDGRFGNVKLT